MTKKDCFRIFRGSHRNEIALNLVEEFRKEYYKSDVTKETNINLDIRHLGSLERIKLLHNIISTNLSNVGSKFYKEKEGESDRFWHFQNNPIYGAQLKNRVTVTFILNNIIVKYNAISRPNQPGNGLLTSKWIKPKYEDLQKQIPPKLLVKDWVKARTSGQSTNSRVIEFIDILLDYEIARRLARDLDENTLGNDFDEIDIGCAICAIIKNSMERPLIEVFPKLLPLFKGSAECRKKKYDWISRNFYIDHESLHMVFGTEEDFQISLPFNGTENKYLQLKAFLNSSTPLEIFREIRSLSYTSDATSLSIVLNYMCDNGHVPSLFYLGLKYFLESKNINMAKQLFNSAANAPISMPIYNDKEKFLRLLHYRMFQINVHIFYAYILTMNTETFDKGFEILESYDIPFSLFLRGLALEDKYSIAATNYYKKIDNKLGGNDKVLLDNVINKIYYVVVIFMDIFIVMNTNEFKEYFNCFGQLIGIIKSYPKSNKLK